MTLKFIISYLVNCTCAAESTLSRHYYRKELMIQYRGENESHPDPNVALNVSYPSQYKLKKPPKEKRMNE